MKAIITALENIIIDYAPQLSAIDEPVFSLQTSPNKWSKKEVPGHLIDSAQNNIRRFIVAQYEEDPRIVYQQDAWVAAADYRHYDSTELLQLWILLNKHICILLNKMPAGAAQRTCNTGKIHTVEWLAADYNKHVLHHLHQVLDLAPVNYP